MADSRESNRPLVSVIMAAYNADSFIAAAIASVLAQTRQHFEVVVVDDASTDGTAAIVRRLADWDARIRLEILPRNSGRPAVPRNRGLRLAAGDLVAFLDADDVWRPGRLADQVQVLDRMGDLVLVYSMLRSIGSAGPLSLEYGVKPPPHKAATNHRALRSENTIPCSAVLARKSAVLAVGGFDEDPMLAAVEDYDLWMRLSERGAIGFIPRVHGYYRAHPLGLSKRTDMSERVRYLFAKRGWGRREECPQARSIGWMSVRALGHQCAFLRARATETWQNARGQAVTVKQG